MYDIEEKLKKQYSLSRQKTKKWTSDHTPVSVAIFYNLIRQRTLIEQDSSKNSIKYFVEDLEKKDLTLIKYLIKSI